MFYKLLILALLITRPCYGYEIRKHLQEGLYICSDINNNTLYPILRRFVEKGYTIKQSIHVDGKPSRIMYTITPIGRKAFMQELLHFSDSVFHNPDEFMLRLMFFDWMDTASRIRLLDGREKCLSDFKMAKEDMITSSDNIVNIFHEYSRGHIAAEQALIDKFRTMIQLPCLMDEHGNPTAECKQQG